MAHLLFFPFVFLALASQFASAAFDNTLISSDVLTKARSGLLSSSTHSWELGTASEALLELENKDLTVFNPDVFPLPDTLPDGYAADVINIAKGVIARMPANASSFDDNNGAAGDPASQGMAVLLANWTRPDKSDHTFGDAALKELNYVLTMVPRHTNGAISHRKSEVQLWADSVYMVPPFLAFAGAVLSNETLLVESYNQIKAYREVLADESGLWKHILLGSWSDSKHWNTGNGWAATGMLRVLYTMKASSFSHKLAGQQTDLTLWTDRLLRAAWSHQAANGTLLNVIDDETAFADATGTAMLASATYRLAALTGDYSMIPFADKAYALIKDSIDEEGRLQNAVNPLDFYKPLNPGQITPEGQAFILILQAAKTEFLKRVAKRNHWQRRARHH
jgi:rhamnogalacturonyl hydrolase YesR